MRLNLRQLDYFVAIIDAGSMSRAADGLNVTPTSLSLQMKQLEEVLGARFLRRHSRGVAPTESGVALYDRAVRILDLVRETERVFVEEGAQTARTVRLGITPAVARMIGVEAMTGVARRFAGIKLLLSEGWTGEMFPKLASGALDFVIAYDLEPQGDIEVIDFHDDEFVFVCRPGRYPVDGMVDLLQVIGSDLVFYGQNSVSWRAVVDAAAAQGLDFKGALEVQSLDVWRGLLSRGLGTAVAPLGTIGEEVRHGDLSVHRIAGAPIVRRICMAARRDVLDFGRESGFTDFISDLVGQLRPAFVKTSLEQSG